MNNLALSEATPVGWIVYTLEGYDPEGGEITFGLVGSDNFMVNPKTGEVKVVKALDREVRKPIYSDRITHTHRFGRERVCMHSIYNIILLFVLHNVM